MWFLNKENKSEFFVSDERLQKIYEQQENMEKIEAPKLEKAETKEETIKEAPKAASKGRKKAVK